MDTNKSYIWTFKKATPTTVTPSIKIAFWLQKELDIPIYCDDSENRGWHKRKIDTLFIVNGAYAFAKALPVLAAAALRAERIIWIMNDYSIVPPKYTSKGQSPFRRAFRVRHKRGLPDTVYWTTVKPYAELPGSTYVNWNALSYTPLDISPQPRRKFKQCVFYYGYYRDSPGQREKVFDRYFASARFPLTISSASKGFGERYPHARIIPNLENFPASLGKYGIGLYLEDEKSSREFHSPATRFYEMLSAGLPIAFQAESAAMFEQCGIDVSPWTVRGPKKVGRMLEHSEDIRAEQYEKLRTVDYGLQVRKQVRKLLRRL